MTPILVLSHAVLAVGWLALGAAGQDARARGARFLGTIGVGMGVVLVLLRGSLEPWRALDLDPTVAAVAGAAVACGWGLTLALDLATARWWTGAFVGVASTGLLLFAGAMWTVPALLFLTTIAAPTYVALERSGRAAWVAIAIADAALVAAFVSEGLMRDGWSLPTSFEGLLIAPLGVAIVLRLCLIPLVGVPLRTAGAALAPVTAGVGFVALLRWVERPEPIMAGGALAVAVAVVAWSVGRRTLNPAVVALWPVALSAGLILVAPRAGASAGVAGIFGLTAVVLWPDALERGRLSRGFLLSSVIPNAAFGALATAAAGSFARAKLDGPLEEVIAWNVVSGLLPIACASGVALGVITARADQRGDYHPEAVFMTWALLFASVVAGGILGTGAVYGVLGGTPAVILFGFATLTGVLAAGRFRAPEAGPPSYSATVVVGPSLQLSRWSVAVAVLAHAGAAGALAWMTLQGLEVGFL